MTIRLTNTLGGAKEEFRPLSSPHVGIYVCGPTVYDVPHVGHARAAVTFDVLRRHLMRRGYDVLFVRNITDVDDKIIKRAAADGVDPAVVAERFTRAYDRAMDALGVLPPDIAPRASGHIPEMLEIVGALVDGGYAYPASGSVYYSVEKFASYGKLSGRSLDDLRAGERVEPAPGKHHPLDFALWKAAKPGEPSWSSPWGRGRPGWHIECSAMAIRYLGSPFDIHGGGADLIFPHHENEIAQSEACTGEPFAMWWLHNGHVRISGEKMSKSLRNYVLVSDVLEDHPPEVLRIFLSTAHYRSPVSYGPEALDEARAVWERFRAFLRTVPASDVEPGAVDAHLEAFDAAMDDDLNTPQAIAELHAIVGEGNRALEDGNAADASAARAALASGLEVLGCVPSGGPTRDVVGPLVELLLAEREEARRRKDFERADEIRSRLGNLGIRVEDSADGARWFME